MQIKTYLQILVTTLSLLLSSMSHSAKDQITVLLDWFINPDHAPLIVAEQAGLFDKESLDVILVEPADPSLPPKLAAAKKADVAISYQPSLMVDLNNQLPLMRIGTIVNSPLNSLVVLADSGIQRISDLKGKTVGFSVGGFEDAVLGAMLESEGLTLDDVNLVNVNFALSPSLYAGKVDAVIGAFRNFELNQMDIDGRPGRAFYPENHGVPAYEELILVAHPDYAGTDKLERFLTVLDQATHMIINDPETSYRSFVSFRPDDLDNELNRRAWRDTLPKLARETRQTDPNSWNQFARFMKHRDLIDNIPDQKTYLFP
ncbi:MAG: ABC transporter ATP-binding protein [Gammaproteobacteria bacterium]|nr:ABC transporter ATP-binding protein [Gammaproteobacteria bacterium]HAN80400.1 ABC transporter ATP-binding protein [Gammaproteobacteria bacterium]|tara:strand:+ start:177 stop:1124 length:948 start_codon:yes stop_codon:yes gene_type:complete